MHNHNNLTTIISLFDVFKGSVIDIALDNFLVE